MHHARITASSGKPLSANGRVLGRPANHLVNRELPSEFQVFEDTSPLVKGLSIDEAFLNVRGLERISVTPAEIAVRLRRHVRERVGLPVTIGVTTTNDHAQKTRPPRPLECPAMRVDQSLFPHVVVAGKPSLRPVRRRGVGAPVGGGERRRGRSARPPGRLRAAVRADTVAPNLAPEVGSPSRRRAPSGREQLVGGGRLSASACPSVRGA